MKYKCFTYQFELNFAFNPAPGITNVYQTETGQN